MPENRKAFFNFEIEDSFEAGICLLGLERKSLRNGKANLSDAYGKFKNGELYLIDAHISPYDQSARENHEPLRIANFLLHKTEIKKIAVRVSAKGAIHLFP